MDFMKEHEELYNMTIEHIKDKARKGRHKSQVVC